MPSKIGVEESAVVGLEPCENLVADAKDRGFEVELDSTDGKIPFAADSFNIVIDLGMLSQAIGSFSHADQTLYEIYRVGKKLGSGKPALSIIASPTQILPSPTDMFLPPAERLSKCFILPGW
jgi:ubiquinone/menaquinone biosynthesis C-methylase UbiE